MFPKPHKYGAQKTQIDGLSFPSKLEAAVYSLLKLREKAGELTDIKLQTSVRLKEKCGHCGDGPLSWKVDFSATDVKTGKTIWIEAKGVRTSDFLKRLRIWRKTRPAKLEIWGGSARRPILQEVIEPVKKGPKASS